MDVNGLRTYVRGHLEVDEEELPNSLLDVDLQDGFERTSSFENRWPRNETVWPASKVLGSQTAVMPPDLLLSSITSVVDQSNGLRLSYITHENALNTYFVGPSSVQTGQSLYYSLWERQLYPWPNPGTDVSIDYVITGYRQPVWSNAASTIPDVDERLHPAIAYYAMSLAYAAQEDEVLEGVYLARWQRDLSGFAKSILEPARHRPLVLNGGSTTPFMSPYVIVPPGP